MDADTLIHLTKFIKTFSEGTDSSESKIDELRKEIHDASTLVFLGFEFRDLNLKLILGKPMKGMESNVRKIFATAFGKSLSDIEQIKIKAHLFSRSHTTSKIFVEDLSCFDFFKHFSLSLQF